MPIYAYRLLYRRIDNHSYTFTIHLNNVKTEREGGFLDMHTNIYIYIDMHIDRYICLYDARLFKKDFGARCLLFPFVFFSLFFFFSFMIFN